MRFNGSIMIQQWVQVDLIWLVVWNMIFIFHFIYVIIISIDELHHFSEGYTYHNKIYPKMDGLRYSKIFNADVSGLTWFEWEFQWWLSQWYFEWWFKAWKHGDTWWLNVDAGWWWLEHLLFYDFPFSCEFQHPNWRTRLHDFSEGVMIYSGTGTTH